VTSNPSSGRRRLMRGGGLALALASILGLAIPLGASATLTSGPAAIIEFSTSAANVALSATAATYNATSSSCTQVPLVTPGCSAILAGSVLRETSGAFQCDQLGTGTVTVNFITVPGVISATVVVPVVIAVPPVAQEAATITGQHSYVDQTGQVWEVTVAGAITSACAATGGATFIGTATLATTA